MIIEATLHNQTEEMIRALRRETNSGYGAVVIWSSQNVMRDLQDIPCNRPPRWEETENCSKYIHHELTQPRPVAKLRRHARECFPLWVGLEPPSWVFRSFRRAYYSVGAFFYCPSLIHARQSDLEQAACVNQSAQTFLGSMHFNTEPDGGKLYMQL